MKKLFTTTIFTVLIACAIAQAPQGISNQAVIRNAANELVISSPIGIKVSILQGSAEGTVVYSETHLPTSNANGLISFVIGQGTVVSGLFAEVDWAAGPYFIKTETDPEGGNNYTITGTSQLLSVPYALHAKTAETVNETDPVFSAAAAGSITGTQIINWNDAFSWGNHNNAGYVPGSRTITINGTLHNLTANRTWNVGTVTSAGLILPGIFSVTGSPVTGSGTLTASLVSQTANRVFASPNASSGIPDFRALVANDIPALDWSKITSGKPTTLAGYGIADAMSTAHPANGITNTNITNWNTAFTNRITSAVGSAPLTLTISSNQLSGSLPAAGTSTNGYLTSAHWNTFNNKVSSQWVTSGSNIYFNAGCVGVGTSAPNTSAQLDVSSLTRGFLPPRLTTAQMNAISGPAQGLMVYNTSLNSVFYYNGSAWINTDDGEPCGNLTYDGMVYKTIMIGTQCWMAENLKYLPSVVGPGTGSNTVSYYYVYGYDGTNVSTAKSTANYQTYGVLYNWPAALTACPSGWHLPTDAEWTALTNYVSTQAAYQCNNSTSNIVKSLAATTNWSAYTGICSVGNNLSANNATGFSGLPGGIRKTFGSFLDMSNYGFWWSAAEYLTTDAWTHYMRYANASVLRNHHPKGDGLSARCVRD